MCKGKVDQMLHVLIANKSSEPILDVFCEAKAGYSLFLCATKLHCCPEANKNVLMSHCFTRSFITVNTETVVIFLYFGGTNPVSP